MPVTAAKKRSLEFFGISLSLGLIAAIAALIFFGWLTDEVLEGDSHGKIVLIP